MSMGDTIVENQWCSPKFSCTLALHHSFHVCLLQSCNSVVLEFVIFNVKQYSSPCDYFFGFNLLTCLLTKFVHDKIQFFSFLLSSNSLFISLGYHLQAVIMKVVICCLQHRHYTILLFVMPSQVTPSLDPQRGFDPDRPSHQAVQNTGTES